MGETSFLKTRRFEASFRREMGNDTEFEASFRREMGNDTNSRRVFSEKRETIRYKMHHFSTKNKKNRGKTGKTGEKTLKNRKKQGKNWKNSGKNTKKTGKNRGKKENYKKYRNEFSTSFWEMLKTETSSETSLGTSLETSLETSSRSSQMSQNDDSRAKTIHRPTPNLDIAPMSVLLVKSFRSVPIMGCYLKCPDMAKLLLWEQYIVAVSGDIQQCFPQQFLDSGAQAHGQAQ